MENREALLELKDVKTYFQVQKGTLKAVNGVDLTIYRGETVGLVGESGCGKSTLGKTIMRLYKPNDGQVLYQGRDIWSYRGKEKKAYAKNVQMIFQDPYACLDPLCVVSDIIAEGLKIHKMCSGAQLEQRVEELLNMVGLGKEHASRFPHEFSGGQRQRIGIARALSLEPQLIVCDEPISALDVSIQAQVVNLLKKLQREMGLSYLFITHDLSMVRQISNRIAVMYLGSLVEIADSEDIYLKNYHPYTKALLSAIPIANPEAERSRKRILLSGDVPSPVNLPKGCNFCQRCSKATERCRTEKPVLREVEKGHMVACHLV
ncbi:MAG: oligopeptide/dipeptide ABC transporter ATP-binding protein [Lachnospiraceae bacterium]|nr:ATP-binding cassette domain-containing protein [Robinsoniella sp.]MDY3767547.1 oligopeptide/dipeptide ABC transporter ATP-binding protein [Lachnospiraceae bacterium]